MERYRANDHAWRIQTTRARIVSGDSPPIPSEYSWVANTDRPGTNCQRRLAADTEQIFMGGEYRSPVHALGVRIATPVCELARNDIHGTIPSE